MESYVDTSKIKIEKTSETTLETENIVTVGLTEVGFNRPTDEN